MDGKYCIYLRIYPSFLPLIIISRLSNRYHFNHRWRIRTFFIRLLYLDQPEKKDLFSFASLCNKNTGWVARVGKTGSRKAWRKERRDPSSQPCHWIRISESLISIGLVRRKGKRGGKGDPEGIRQRMDRETGHGCVKQQTEAGRISRKKKAKKSEKTIKREKDKFLREPEGFLFLFFFTLCGSVGIISFTSCLIHARLTPLRRGPVAGPCTMDGACHPRLHNAIIEMQNTHTHIYRLMIADF